MKMTKIALVYDFDKTLSTNDMEAFHFIPSLGMTENEFWDKCDKFGEEHDADNILTYMYMMIKCFNDKKFPLTRDYLVSCGNSVQFFKGVETWFNRIDDFGKKYGVEVEHYVVSSGLKEIIEGTSIAKYFKEIYAGYFAYENNKPVWPALALNYTNKTQFLYRINKGIFDIKDNRVNEEMPHDERLIPFSNMIYIGDSETDIPCMRLVKKNGGTAIGLYQKNTKNEKYLRDLQFRERIDFVAEANYEENSELDTIIKELIKEIKHQSNLSSIKIAQKHISNN
jgi:phosphoglycolate phosphatase-like HAD superfamily hydrolase